VAAAILAAVEPGFPPGGTERALELSAGIQQKSPLSSGRLEAALYGRQRCLPPQAGVELLHRQVVRPSSPYSSHEPGRILKEFFSEDRTRRFSDRPKIFERRSMWRLQWGEEAIESSSAKNRV